MMSQATLLGSSKGFHGENCFDAVDRESSVQNNEKAKG